MTAEPKIGILAMPMGNRRSVHNAVLINGFDPVAVDQGEDFDQLTHLIVPGVGHYGAAVDYLCATGLGARIKAFAASGRPLLGICVGMQVLAQSGMEGGETAGLGLVSGVVARLPDDKHVLPHVGWSTVEPRFDHPILGGIKPARDFYFVHSYALQDGEPSERLGEAHYGAAFTAIVAKNNVIGFQFHPEKSQANGLRLIENFCRWDGRA